MRVRLLGGLHVDGVDVARLGSRKGRTLLARLALAAGQPVGVDALVDVLWPDAPPANPSDQLSVLVSRARATLGAERIPRTTAGYTLRLDWLDLTALGELAAEAARRLTTGSAVTARAAAQAALDLVRGPLLPDEPPDAPWLEAERGALARTLAEVRRVGAEAALRGGDPWAAAEWAATGVAAEPYDEAALRLLMSAHAAAGRPALALRAYAEAAERLADELGVDPSPETQALHVDLLRGGPREPAAPQPATGVREAELAMLDEALRQRRALVVDVEGESGIGKTWLLDTWAAGLPDRVTVLRAAGDELLRTLPLQPLIDALGGYLRREQPPVDVLTGEAEPLRPLVGVGGAPATPGLTALLSSADRPGRGLLFAALDAVFRRLADEGPVVLLLDDAHWADPMTLAWLQHAVRALARSPLLVVAARWPEEGTPLRAATRLRLGPLALAEAARLLRSTEAEVTGLYRRTGGHPYFLLELARTGDGEPGDDDVPEAVRAAVRDRCDRTGDAAPTLRAAAVLGPEVDLDLLAGVLNRPPGELLDHLEEGVRRHLLVERGIGFAFGHQLLRDALRATVTAGRQALLHRDAARTLAARLTRDPLEIAHHARLGGDVEVEARALAEAAEVALSRYDHPGALRLLDEAVAVRGPLAWLLVRRARGHLLVGRPERAAADAVDALAAGAGAEALEVAAIAAYQQRDLAHAAEYAEEGARLAEPGDTRVSCLAIAGRVRHAMGELTRAQELLTEASRLATPAARAVVEVWLAYLRVHQGDPGPGLLLRAVPQVSVGPLHALPYRHLAEAHAHAMRGEPIAALRAFDALEEEARRQRTERFAGRAFNFRGWILRNLGEAAAADDHNARALEQARAAGNVEPVAHALLDLADSRLRAGDPAAARALLSESEALGSGYAFAWRHTLRERLLAGRVLLASEDAWGAAEAFSWVRAEADRIGLPRYAVQARLWLARARMAAGERVAPDEIAGDVLALDRVAPLEAWWLTADLARLCTVDAWRALAADRVTRLAALSGPYADSLRRAAARLEDQHR